MNSNKRFDFVINKKTLPRLIIIFLAIVAGVAVEQLVGKYGIISGVIFLIILECVSRYIVKKNAEDPSNHVNHTQRQKIFIFGGTAIIILIIVALIIWADQLQSFYI